MRDLGASGLGSATSREREARPGPATGPHAARSRAPISCPVPGPHHPPLTGPQGRFFTRSAMFAARRRSRPANQTHPFRPHLHRAVQSESQWRAGAWPRRLEVLQARGLGRARWVSSVRVGSGVEVGCRSCHRPRRSKGVPCAVLSWILGRLESRPPFPHERDT